MRRWLQNWFSPPNFEDEEKTRLAHRLNTIILLAFGVTILSGISTLLTNDEPIANMIIFGIFMSVELIAYALMRSGYVQFAGLLFSILIWSVMALSAYFFGGVRGASYSAHLIVVLIIGLILGGRGIIFFVVLSILTGLVLLIIEEQGSLPLNTQSLTPLNAWISQAMVLALGAWLLRLATQDLTQTLRRARQNEKALINNNRQLVTEIIERQRAEADLKRSEEKYSKLFRHSNDGILLLTQSFSLTDANQKGAELMGYSLSELCTLTLADLQLPHDTALLTPTLQEILRQGFVEAETQFRKRDGTIFPAEISASLVTIEPEPVIQFIVRDITLRLQAQAAWQAANDVLEQRVQARTAELASANEQLEQFAYVASHDLRAPLRGIASLAKWIEEDLEDVLTEETQEYMNLLHRRVQRMEDLIEGILEYSRTDQTESNIEKVDVAQLLEDVVDLLAPPAAFNIQVGTMPTLMTERIKLEQVFSNLISNAIKYHDRPNGCIVVSGNKNGRFYEFQVTDDGPGIAPQFHQKIFSIFETLQSRDNVESSGVGLALVKKIIETKGGWIGIESQEGEGATFRFTWPLSQNNL